MESDMVQRPENPDVSNNTINQAAMSSQNPSGDTGKPLQPGKTADAQQLADRDSSPNGANHGNLDFVLDIPMTLTVELGRSQMLINELLKLGRGSVIELSKLAGEPLDILANQRLIARGEVVVVNEKYGIRITEIISPAERVERLR